MTCQGSKIKTLSLVYWFFYYLRSDSQQTINKARYDAICLQGCPNIWGYGLHSKRFEGSRLYSKILLGLQATRRWGSGLRGQNFRASGLPPPPPPLWDPVKLIMFYFKPASRCLLLSKMNSSKQENLSKFSFYNQIYN